MKKNFEIKDGVLFDLAGEILDIRGDCELISVEFRPGDSPRIEMNWKIDRSNQRIQLIFSSVEDFIVKGRDRAYPFKSGAMLAIAGFSDGVSCGNEDQLYVDSTPGMNYMSFVMDDMSAILVKAELATMRLV